VIFVANQIKHLLVDGNNVGRAWGETGKLWRRDADAARRRVVERVQTWHDAMGWRVSVVFDGRGDTLQVEQPGADATFVVAYSPSGVTADTVLEQWVANSRHPEDCVVATADRALRSLVEAQGASVIGSRALASWLERAEEVQRRGVDSWRARQEHDGAGE
jgi:predicted RNA-binding protein with PIN domain